MAWAESRVPEMVSALVQHAPYGASRREVLHAASADTALDVAYVLMVREVAEASSVPYRQAREEVDKMLKAVVPKTQDEIDRETFARSVVRMAKYRKAGV